MRREIYKDKTQGRNSRQQLESTLQARTLTDVIPHVMTSTAAIVIGSETEKNTEVTLLAYYRLTHRAY
jgi:hypothetical protein